MTSESPFQKTAETRNNNSKKTSPLLFSIKKRLFHQIQPKRNENTRHLRMGTFYYNRNISKRKNSKILLTHKSSCLKLNEHLRDEALDKLCTDPSSNLHPHSNILSFSPCTSTRSILKPSSQRHPLNSLKHCFPSSKNKRVFHYNINDISIKDKEANNSNIDIYQQNVVVSTPNSYRDDNYSKVNMSSCNYKKPSLSPIMKKRKNLLLNNNINLHSHNDITTIHKTKHVLPKLPSIITLYPSNNKHNDISIKYSSLSNSGFLLSQQTSKTNQDRILIFPNILNIPHFSTFAVLDGHGQNGHFISQLSKDFLYSYYNNSTLYYLPRNTTALHMKSLHNHISSSEAINKLLDNNNAIISSSIKQLQHKIKESEYETDFSGTTLCQVFISDNKVICVNIGDSRALLIRKEEIVMLSDDHKPWKKEERKRIELNGGEIRKGEGNMGCERVYVKNMKYPGIAMSRSLGDIIAKGIGVSCEPDVKVIMRKEGDIGVLLASDGVWEGLSNEYVGNVFRKGNNMGNCFFVVNTLYNDAKEAFINKKENIDDISVIAIFFN